jgi:hypothetical protein
MRKVAKADERKAQEDEDFRQYHDKVDKALEGSLSVPASQGQDDKEFQLYVQLIENKGIAANLNEVKDILDLKKVRAECSALKKQEDILKERVTAIASKYPGVVEISQNKDSQKTDYEKVIEELKRDFNLDPEIVRRAVSKYTETRPGAKVLKVVL